MTGAQRMQSRLRMARKGLAIALALSALSALVWIAGSFWSRGPLVTLRVETLAEGTPPARVYYDLGQGLSERNAVSAEVRGENGFRGYRFAWPASPVSHIRFDPPAGRTVLGKAFIAAEFAEKLTWTLLTIDLAYFKAGQEIRSLELSGDRLTIDTVGGAKDPQLWIGITEPIDIPSSRISTAFVLLKLALAILAGLAAFAGVQSFLRLTRSARKSPSVPNEPEGG